MSRVGLKAGGALLLLNTLAGCDGDKPPLRAAFATDKVEVAAATVEVGVKRGSLRATAEVASFRIAKLPVTMGEYLECTRSGLCKGLASPEPHSCNVRPETADAEVVASCLSVQQASAYCEWVGGRLPTLSEWLVAARGPQVQRFAWGDEAPSCKQHWSGVCPERLKECPDSDVKGCMPTLSLMVGKHPKGAALSGMQDALLSVGGELVAGDAGGDIFGCANPQSVCLIKSSDDAPSSIDFITVPRAEQPEGQMSQNHTFGFRCAWGAE